MFHDAISLAVEINKIGEHTSRMHINNHLKLNCVAQVAKRITLISKGENI